MKLGFVQPFSIKEITKPVLRALVAIEAKNRGNEDPYKETQGQATNLLWYAAEYGYDGEYQGSRKPNYQELLNKRNTPILR